MLDNYNALVAPGGAASKAEAPNPKLAAIAAVSSNDPNLVCFRENDPDDPLNWSSRRKWFICIFLSIQVHISSIRGHRGGIFMLSPF
jgi:hypothetical protein